MHIRTTPHLTPVAPLLLAAAFLHFAPRVQAQDGTVSLPTNLVGVTVFPPITNIWELTNSFAPVALTNVPGGYCVSNQYYHGWCVDAATAMANDPFSARLYDSLGTNLPAYLQAEPWSQINYVLNHKLGAPYDAQEAIWYVQDRTDLVDIDPGPIRDMVAAARQFGTNYVPVAGQIRAVVLDPSSGVQRLVIEIPTPPGNQTNGPTLAIIRSNNTVIVSWPSPSAGWTLQQNTNSVGTVNWSNVLTTPTDDGSTKTLIVNPPAGNRFYRLSR